jgi:hypothetical protein
MSGGNEEVRVVYGKIHACVFSPFLVFWERFGMFPFFSFLFAYFVFLLCSLSSVS